MRVVVPDVAGSSPVTHPIQTRRSTACGFDFSAASSRPRAFRGANVEQTPSVWTALAGTAQNVPGCHATFCPGSEHGLDRRNPPHLTLTVAADRCSAAGGGR
jgi:hypothetical protein